MSVIIQEYDKVVFAMQGDCRYWATHITMNKIQEGASSFCLRRMEWLMRILCKNTGFAVRKWRGGLDGDFLCNLIKVLWQYLLG
jgi:hypothetical protein